MQEEAEIREDHGRRLKGAHSLWGVLDLPRSEGWTDSQSPEGYESISFLASLISCFSFLASSFLDAPYWHSGAHPNV